jgi:hypothetical protein
MGLVITVVGILGALAALSGDQPSAVRISGLGLVALCLVLGTILQLAGKLDDD